MLKSLLSVALTNLIRERTSSAANILVITCFITFALVLMLNLIYESSFDQYHRKGDNIYRIVSNIKDGDNESRWDVSQASLGPELLRRYPEVKNSVRFAALGKMFFKTLNREYEEDAFYYADPAVFNMFTYEIIQGDGYEALLKPYSIVLTERLAIRYFGSAFKAIDQPLSNDKGETFTITAVMKDVPPNSHFTFDALVSANTGAGIQGGWANFSTHTYIELPSNYNVSRMCGQLNSLASEKLRPLGDHLEVSVTYQLQKLTRIYQSTTGDGQHDQAGIAAVASGLVILMVGVVVLFRQKRHSSTFFRQGGELTSAMVRQRRNIIMQLIAESMCITGVAFFLSIGVVYAILPLFNELLNKKIPFSMIWDSSVALLMLAVFLFAGFASAVYLSYFLPKPIVLGGLGSAIKKEEIFLA